MAGDGSNLRDPNHRRGKSTGHSNFKKGKRFQSAIKKALLGYEKGDVKAGFALDAIAVRLVHEALTSDDAAMVKYCISEIGNRLDGKPDQHKTVDKSVTTDFAGLSEAVGILQKFAGFREDNPAPGTLSH